MKTFDFIQSKFSISRIPLNRTQFYKTRNTLAREIYGIIFGKLLSAFNYQHDHNTIPYIGIIDMAGFGNRYFIIPTLNITWI